MMLDHVLVSALSCAQGFLGRLSDVWCYAHLHAETEELGKHAPMPKHVVQAAYGREPD